MCENIVIYDIETPKEMFLIVIYDPELGKTFKFEISRRKNQIDKFIRFTEKYEDYYWIGFNCIRFDGQVVEWIIRNYEKWGEKTGPEIAYMIYQKAQDVIDDSNYNIYPDYQEYQLWAKQLDLFTIWHFNNENRRTSLKAVEFAINFENIEESSVPFDKEDMTDEDMDDMDHYCVNDVNATYALYKITRGDTDLPQYRGKDKLSDRFIMQEEFGLNCLNWDDVKIGAEWNKHDYMKLTGKREQYLKPEKVNHFYGKRFRQFFPKTVKFKTPELKKFVRELGNTFVLNKRQEFKFDFSELEKYIKDGHTKR